MNFKVNSKELERLLSRVIPAIPVKTTMPLLENFLIEIKEGEMKVSATDLEISLSSSMSIDAADNVTMVMPARLLYDIVRQFKDTMINFEIEENQKVTLKTDNGVYNLSYAPADDFPVIQAVEADMEITIGGKEFKKAIEQTAFAMSKEDMRPAMTGTLLEFAEDGLRFVATDGHRLVKYINKKITTETLQQYIIPERAISVLIKLLTDSEVKVEIGKTNISVHLDNLEFISRLIGEKYPAYNSVIPLENENKLKVNTDELRSTIKRMLLFSTSNLKQVKFSLNENNLEISAEDIDHGSNAKENIFCSYSGNPMEIGFNTNYVNDILSNINFNEIIFKLHSPTKACIIEPAEINENEDLMLLLMPIRLNS
jgi:DNA polymerase III subunit beta